jgi:hypothetical protein
MTNRKNIWGLGIVLASMAGACKPELRALGDEPAVGGAPSVDGGRGGASNNMSQKGGSSSVLPQGGKTSTPATSAGRGPTSGGVPAVDECFSPTENLDLAIESGTGCACDDDPPECVRTMYDGRPHDVALQCIDGRWVSVQDGACGESSTTDCKVGGVSYPSGARRIRSPFDACNTCDCNEGELDNCTLGRCASTTCGEGSSPARRCLGCGPGGKCTEYEIGCLSGEGCETGLCSSPSCG